MKMRAVQISKPGADFEMVEREIPEPGENEVRIKVAACGICHSDAMVKDGHWPGVSYPRIPGHEVTGTIDKVGAKVLYHKVGERAGVGWHGGHCGQCRYCLVGDPLNCLTEVITGFYKDGGYAEYMLARAEAVTKLPDKINDNDAAPLLCAGITTFNALRNSGARTGGVVAVQGIGGLGHLGIQYARKMGFRTVAISSGAEKEPLARELGTTDYVDTSKGSASDLLQKLGGADVILTTAPHSKSIAPLLGGLKPRGKLLIVAAAADPMEIVPAMLLSGKSISGWPSGSAADWEDTLSFSAENHVLPMIETFPLEKVKEAYERMMSNKARFRVVLTLS